MAYTLLAEVEDKAENCSRTIEACQEALKNVDFRDEPWDYPLTHRTLGDAYRILAEVEDKAGNCGRAQKAYEEALRVFTKEEFPDVYSQLDHNLRELANFCDSG